MFEGMPEADFSIHHKISEEEIKTYSMQKEVCPIGFEYVDIYGEKTVYTGKKENNLNLNENIVKRITDEVLKKLEER